MRLDKCGKSLSSFLSDDLSEAHLGLPPGARAHLDTFRSFLQSFYVAKLGYYPPSSGDADCSAFPKSIYAQMCNEFQKLYDFLVDLNSSGSIAVSQHGGICALQSVQAFDRRHKYPSLKYQMPLLPEMDEESSSRPAPNRRFSFMPKPDKMKPNPRLVAFSSLSKATNRANQSLFECSLVRAYRGFEKDCIFNPSKADKHEKLTQTDARKVRWILIYSVLQTLLSATRAPEQVRDTQNVPYNIAVLTAGCPPWKEVRPIETLLRSQTDQTREDFVASAAKPDLESLTFSPTDNELKPDIDYLALAQRPQQRKNSESSIKNLCSKKSTIKKALSTLGQMPPLHHPKPQRNSFHEILVHGYGNGTNNVIISADPASIEEKHQTARKLSTESRTSSMEDLSSRWSNTDAADSRTTSLSSSSRRGSDASTGASKMSIKEFLGMPLSSLGLTRAPSSVYSESLYSESEPMQPAPLQVNKASLESDFMRVTSEVTVEWQKPAGRLFEKM